MIDQQPTSHQAVAHVLDWRVAQIAERTEV